MILQRFHGSFYNRLFPLHKYI